MDESEIVCLGAGGSMRMLLRRRLSDGTIYVII